MDPLAKCHLVVMAFPLRADNGPTLIPIEFSGDPEQYC